MTFLPMHTAMLTLAELPTFINQHLGWFLFGLILLIGFAVGAKDFARFSGKRIWAISGVCFDESIRRRVLLITPLAILGVIIVSQLQRPLDEQDAIRQTTKFCLFATGLIVTITTIILACTNLPREIDNRVIFTVVTKPTTRLEIVIGKLLGFIKVSLLILIIMGVFSWGYLELRAWNFRREIATRLESNAVPASSVGTLRYYNQAGLLNAKTLESPDALQVYAHVPPAGESRRYMFGGDGNFNVAFDVLPDWIAEQGADPANTPLVVVAEVGYIKRKKGADSVAPPTPEPKPATQATTGPASRPYYGPFIMSPEERARVMSGFKPVETPLVSIDVMDSTMYSVGNVTPIPPLKTFEMGDPNELTELRGTIDPKIAKNLKGRCYLRVNGASQDVEYFIDLNRTPSPIQLYVPVQAGAPAGAGQAPQVALKPIAPVADPLDASKPMGPIFKTREGTFGMQLRGGSERSSTAIFQFRGANVSAAEGENAPFELRGGVERSGDDTAEKDAEQPTRVSVRVQNRTSGMTTDEIVVQPESNRTVLFEVPSKALEGGNFDVFVRCLTVGDYLGVSNKSLSLITARHPFAWNLAKSLLILWLMTILVTAVAIFTSTFLSWPIAVVLTLVILLGHWGVDQLGDAIAPGIGNQVVTDFGLKSPAKAEAVRATVEKLSSFLNFISTILPDINKYPAVEDIERGISIPPAKMTDALAVTFGFGIPLVLLAYVFLKNKEVAP